MATRALFIWEKEACSFRPLGGDVGPLGSAPGYAAAEEQVAVVLRLLCHHLCGPGRRLPGGQRPLPLVGALGLWNVLPAVMRPPALSSDLSTQGLQAHKAQACGTADRDSQPILEDIFSSTACPALSAPPWSRWLRCNPSSQPQPPPSWCFSAPALPCSLSPARASSTCSLLIFGLGCLGASQLGVLGMSHLAKRFGMVGFGLWAFRAS